MNKNIIKFLGTLLFLGLCIFMLSEETKVYAADPVAKLNVKSVSLIKDGTFKLKVYNLGEGETVIYRSGDSTIASVSTNGTIKGISYGSATITAVVMNGETAKATLQCDVLIGPAAVSVKFTKSEIVLPVGKSKILKVQVTPLNTVESPVFYSSDTDVVAVSSVGRVRAKKIGIVQVYAFLSNNLSAVCEVCVVSEEDYQSYLDGKSAEDIKKELAELLSNEEVTDESEILENEELPENAEESKSEPSKESLENEELVILLPAAELEAPAEEAGLTAENSAEEPAFEI